MDNETMLNGLIAVKNNAGYPALKFLLEQRIEAVRTSLESDARISDFNQMCLLRGEVGAYRVLLSLFEKDLQLLKDQNNQDKEHEQPMEMTLGNTEDIK